jgi:acyl-CoA reductase-like NAD-dependent aldehyde dehydrogenase
MTMKKITALLSLVALALTLNGVAFAQDTGTTSPAGVTPTSTSLTSTVSKLHPLDTTCMKSAVDARESAVQAAFSAFSTARSAALTQRASALDAAWSLTDRKAITAAVKTAWSTFKTTNGAARKSYNTAIRSAWSTFSASAKTCKGMPSAPETQSVDSTL